MGRYKLPYSLYKRGKYWYYRTYDNRGMRTSGKSTGCKTKTDAKKYCESLYLAGDLWSNQKLFIDYAKHFYDDDSMYVRDRITPLAENTLLNYRKRMKTSIIPFFKDKKIADIKYTDLKMFRASLLQDGYAPSVAIATMSTLKHIFDYAFRDGIIGSNPFDYLETFKAPTASRDAFNLDEVVFVYNNILPEFRNQILLMALTGMRISEAVGVEEQDIIKGDGFYYIHLTKQYNLGKYKPLKNKSFRDIPIAEEIIKLIGFNKKRIPAFYRHYQPVKNLIKDADERNLSFHSLRHFFITNAKASGVIESKVETIAGHSLKGMSKIYTNYNADDLKDIIDWQREQLKKIGI